MESLPQEYPQRDGISRGSASTGDGCVADYSRDEAANDTRIAKLARAIEQEIIPRLMLAHRSVPEGPVRKTAAQGRRIDADDVKLFAKLVLATDDEACSEGVRAFRDLGASTESIYVDLLAPTARYLGHLWDEDLCSFSDVTIGLGRLQRILRELSPAFDRPALNIGNGRKVLLLPSPGEQHTLGLVMVGEFFRSAGWEVSGGAWTANIDTAALVKDEWFDVVGFSLGAEIHLQRLADAIEAVRQASCNGNLAVLVGGPLFGAQPSLAERVGADGMTIDGREAPLLADTLVARGRERGVAQSG